MIEVGDMGRPRAAPTGPAWYRDLSEAWMRSLTRRGRARGTERTYRWLLRDFGTWLDHCRVESAQHLVVEVVYSWQDSLVERELSPSARSLASIVLRGLLRWGAREHFGIPAVLWEHVDAVERHETEPRALEPEHLAEVLAHYARADRGLEQLRDRALFLFLLTTGSRISAALSLDVAQIGTGRLVVRQKGGSEHALLPSATARQWLQAYLRQRGRDEQPALWIREGKRGRHRLTPTDANGIWAALCAELRIPVFTSHAIKHTSVTELGERGFSDAEIAKHVGWKGTAMVARYRKLRETRRQQLVDQLDDLVPAVPVEPVPVPRRRRPRMAVIKGLPRNDLHR